jgi:hypothetical protein
MKVCVGTGAPLRAAMRTTAPNSMAISSGLPANRSWHIEAITKDGRPPSSLSSLILAHGRQLFTTRNKGHIARRGQARAKIPADAVRPHYRNVHRLPPAFATITA